MRPFKNLLLVGLSVAVTLAGVEGICFLLNRFGYQMQRTSSYYSNKLDRSQNHGKSFFEIRNGITFLRPNFSERSILKLLANEEVYNVRVSTDEFGRRKTPKLLGKRDQHALFLGCSWTFGEGAEDSQTIPFYFSAKSETFHAYNLGISGDGVNDMLARIRNDRKKYWEGIEEKDGVAVYVHLSVHIYRLLGSMRWMTFGMGSRPYLTQTSDGEIHHMGSFEEGRPFITSIYKFFNQLEFTKFFGINLPVITDSDWQFFSDVIVQIKNEYLKAFPKGKFYVALLPRHPLVEKSKLTPYLEKAGISFLDYNQNELQDLLAEPAFHTFDTHPTPAANKFLGQKIADGISLSYSVQP